MERNALRAHLVASAQPWCWSRLGHRVSPTVTVAAWPLGRVPQWLEYVHQVETEAELKALRRSPQGGTPFGATVWQQATAKRLGLELTLRPAGRGARQS